MKSILLALLLLIPVTKADETNTFSFTFTLNITLITPTILNVSSNMVRTPHNISKAQKLQLEILKDEKELVKLTNGVPTTFGTISAEGSEIMINSLENIWKQYDMAISNLNVKRIELNKLTGNK
jgi:hypothetical protein